MKRGRPTETDLERVEGELPAVPPGPGHGRRGLAAAPCEQIRLGWFRSERAALLSPLVRSSQAAGVVLERGGGGLCALSDRWGRAAARSNGFPFLLLF